MEVGRLLEVPMPKFYTAEGRKALVLRKGFSSPTRDDVSTALGAWAIKTSKPFAHSRLAALSDSTLARLACCVE